jgi:hypothetical protein
VACSTAWPRDLRPSGDVRHRPTISASVVTQLVTQVGRDFVPIENISRLVGHSGRAVTELVYRFQICPVLGDGATAMNEIFPGRDRAEAPPGAQEDAPSPEPGRLPFDTECSNVPGRPHSAARIVTHFDTHPARRRRQGSVNPPRSHRCRHPRCEYAQDPSQAPLGTPNAT